MAFLIDCDKKEEFSIPKGETVIGRGPYLRVKEQILSRSHAVLLFNDGVVKIKPIHRHPTYFYSADSLETGVPLEKDEWKDLQDGNCISLLSNAYKYHVKIASHRGSNDADVDSENKVDEQQNTPLKSEKLFDKSTAAHVPYSLQNDEALDKTLPVDTPTIKKEKDAAKSRCDESLVVGTSRSKEVLPAMKCKFDETASLGHKQNTISPNKKRRLPAWMCESEVVVKKMKVTPRKPAPKKAPGKAKSTIRHKNMESSLLQDVPDDRTVDRGITTAAEENSIRSKGSPHNKAVIDSPPSSPSMLDPSPHNESVVDSPSNSPSKLDISLPHKSVIDSPSNSPSMLDVPPPQKSDMDSPANSPSMLDTSPPQKFDIDSPANSPSMLDASPPQKSDIDTPTNSPSMLDDLSVQDLVGDGETHQYTLPPDKQKSQIETSPLHEGSYNISAGSLSPTKVASHLAETKATTPTKKKDEKEKTTGEERVTKKDASHDPSGEDKTNETVKRCPYGKRCYRKNPAHYREFSHPSHDDDNEDDNEDNDDKKQKSECPYGMDCYRQTNPHHTQEFAHNLLGKQRRRRAARHTKGRNKKGKSLLDKESDNDGDNEYDLNDSFIASSDYSSGYSDDPDDSDYDPRGGKDDDDDEEDVDDLVSEAKGFIKNKKM